MQDKADEQFLFEKIREKYRQSARLTARWYDYIERTSNYSKLEAAKVIALPRETEQSKLNNGPINNCLVTYICRPKCRDKLNSQRRGARRIRKQLTI